MAMNDDELLAATVEAARDDARRAHEERLDAYADRRISAAEVTALARAAGVDDNLDDELRAFRPVDDEARARIAARVTAELATRAPASGKGARVGVRSWTFRSVTIAAGVLTMAAAVALVVRTRDAALPAYEIAFVGGDQALRGAVPAAVAPVHKFSRGESFRMVLRPRTALGGPVAARLFLRRGADVRAWDAPVDVSSEGAVRVVASLDTLPAASEGDWDLVVVVGRPDAVPRAAADLGDALDSGAQRVVTRVRFEP